MSDDVKENTGTPGCADGCYWGHKTRGGVGIWVPRCKICGLINWDEIAEQLAKIKEPLQAELDRVTAELNAERHSESMELVELHAALDRVTAERDEARKEVSNQSYGDAKAAVEKTRLTEEREARIAAERDQLRYERQILGYARRILDRAAEYENLSPVDRPILRREAADCAQWIVDEIGHPVTDEPALGPELREEVERLTAERDRLEANRNELHDSWQAALVELAATKERLQGSREHVEEEHHKVVNYSRDIRELLDQRDEDRRKIARLNVDLEEAVGLATDLEQERDQLRAALAGLESTPDSKADPYAACPTCTESHCCICSGDATFCPASPSHPPLPAKPPNACSRCGGLDGTHAARDCQMDRSSVNEAPPALRYPHARCSAPTLGLHIPHTWGDPVHWCGGEPKADGPEQTEPGDDESCPGRPITPGVPNDGMHCGHWYDGEACCRCGAPADPAVCPRCGENGGDGSQDCAGCKQPGPEQTEPGEAVTYRVITSQIVGKPDDWQTDYYDPLEPFDDREIANRHGEELLGHDDFCIATLRGGMLWAYGPGMVDFGPEDWETLPEVARQLALKVHPDASSVPAAGASEAGQ